VGDIIKMDLKEIGRGMRAGFFCFTIGSSNIFLYVNEILVHEKLRNF
jgi:hypothetical protein